MNKSSFLLIICFLPSLLFSLDIWINGEFHHSYGMEELQDYGVADNPLHEGTLELERIVPLFDDVYRIEAYGGRNRIVLEEPADLLTSLSLVFTSEGFYLSRGITVSKTHLVWIYGARRAKRIRSWPYSRKGPFH